MKVYSEITHKWYDTPGECLRDEANPSNEQRRAEIEAAEKDAIEKLKLAHECVKYADSAMFLAAIAMLECNRLGGELVDVEDIDYGNDHATMLQTLMGVRAKIEMIENLHKMTEAVMRLSEELKSEADAADSQDPIEQTSSSSEQFDETPAVAEQENNLKLFIEDMLKQQTVPESTDFPTEK